MVVQKLCVSDVMMYTAIQLGLWHCTPDICCHRSHGWKCSVHIPQHFTSLHTPQHTISVHSTKSSLPSCRLSECFVQSFKATVQAADEDGVPFQQTFAGHIEQHHMLQPRRHLVCCFSGTRYVPNLTYWDQIMARPQVVAKQYRRNSMNCNSTSISL